MASNPTYSRSRGSSYYGASIGGYHVGDPFLGGIWKGIKKVLKVPAKAVQGAVTGFITGGPVGAITGGVTGGVQQIAQTLGIKGPQAAATMQQQAMQQQATGAPVFAGIGPGGFPTFLPPAQAQQLQAGVPVPATRGGLPMVGTIGGAPMVEVRQHRRCPRGQVLAVDGNCYPRSMVPRSLRAWRPTPKPPVTRGDVVAINRAAAAKKRVRRLASKAGALPKRQPCRKGKR